MTGDNASDFPTNKALKVIEPFIGSWSTVGEHGMIPNTKLHGNTTFAWHESGAFIRMSSYIEEKVGVPRGVAMTM